MIIYSSFTIKADIIVDNLLLKIVSSIITISTSPNNSFKNTFFFKLINSKFVYIRLYLLFHFVCMFIFKKTNWELKSKFQQWIARKWTSLSKNQTVLKSDFYHNKKVIDIEILEY